MRPETRLPVLHSMPLSRLIPFWFSGEPEEGDALGKAINAFPTFVMIRWFALLVQGSTVNGGFPASASRKPEMGKHRGRKTGVGSVLSDKPDHGWDGE